MRIAMWSGPRNISTALMRSFENRPDCVVYDEPFYAYYLDSTKIDHPLKKEIIKNGNIKFQSIIKELTGPIPLNKKIWYQKHMAHHNKDDFDLNWIKKLHNCILIRDPRQVISSYISKFKLNSINQLGFPQQYELYNFIKSQGDIPIIIDATDLLKNPEKILQTLCKKLSIPFYNQMLSWPKGKRNTDGIWGKYWYTNVQETTGFIPYNENIYKLDKKYNIILSKCIQYYMELYNNRI